jgi:hypothetical protein
VLVVAPVVAVALVVRRLRRPPLLLALVAGGVLGWLVWIVEAFVRFGDPIARLQAAEEAGPKGLGLDFTFLLALPRLLDGNPYYFAGDAPEQAGALPVTLTTWLLAVIVCTALGVAAAAAQRRLPEILLVLAPAAVVAGFYLLLPAFTSVRFLVPAFALLAVPVATALVHAVSTTSGSVRRFVIGFVAVGVVLHIAMMIVGAHRNLDGQAVHRGEHLQAAEALRPLTEREHCLVVGQEPQATAYYLGCKVQQARPIPNPQGPVSEAIAAGEDVVAVLANPPAPDGSYLQSWEPIDVPGLPEGWRAYVPPS